MVLKALKMPIKHLKAGDALPPYTPGTIRLFSMRFCPFAQRTRLVLLAKNIQYDEVNCSVGQRQKPEFLLERNPAGQVPVFEKDGFVLYESLNICDLLEDLYPDRRPLYPKDPFEKARQKLIITRNSSDLVPAFYKALFDVKDKEKFEKYLKMLEREEEILKNCKTTYFFGDKPGMVDYMVWPWYERILLFSNSDEIFQKFPNIAEYIEQMRKDPSVQKLWEHGDAIVEFYSDYGKGKVDWDELDKY